MSRLLRDGKYVVFHNNTYDFFGDQGSTDEMVYIVSRNKDDIKNGFIPINVEYNKKYGFFQCQKEVPKNEITEAYKIKTYALYKGLKFDIIGSHQEGTNILLNLCGNQISSHNPSEEERKYEEKLIKIGFHMGIVDKTFYMYEKSVPMDDPELEFFEQRTEIDLSKL